MIEIVPTIIAKDFEEVKDKVRRAEAFFSWAQLDIMDGQFVEKETWHQPEDLKELKTRLNLEAHLMIEKPWQTIDAWLATDIKRIIVHWEAFPVGTRPGIKVRGRRGAFLQQMIDQTKNQQKEFGLAINPETSVDVLRHWLDQLNLVLIMTVNPGRGGQKFMDETIPKIKQLRRIWPQGIISVDGGIKPDSAKQCVAAGVNILSVGSYLWSAPDLRKAAKALREIIKD